MANRPATGKKAQRQALASRDRAFEILDRHRIPQPRLSPELSPEFQGFLLSTFAKVSSDFIATVEAGRNPDALDLAYRSAASDLARMLDGMPTTVDFVDGPRRATLACRKGCDHCCNLRVVASPVTVLSMARYLRKKLAEDELQALLERLRRFDEATAPLAPLEQNHRSMMCPVNQDGLCLAYPARPLVCQGYHSFDLARCVELQIDPLEEGKVPMDARRVELRNVLLAAVSLATTALGLNADDLELVPALRIALERPDAAVRYLAGEAIFAPAHRPEVGEARDAFRRGRTTLPMR